MFLAIALFYESNDEGRILWVSCINYFKELLHNFRIRNEAEIFFTNFLSNARKGIVSDEDLLIINSECYRIDINEAILKTKEKPRTIWLASTHKEVNYINQTNKKLLLLKENILTLDVIAKHTSLKSIIDLEKSKTLFKVTKRSIKQKKTEGDNKIKFPDPILSLSIGTRVKIIGNLATEIGNVLILSLLLFY